MTHHGTKEGTAPRPADPTPAVPLLQGGAARTQKHETSTAAPLPVGAIIGMIGPGPVALWGRTWQRGQTWVSLVSQELVLLAPHL